MRKYIHYLLIVFAFSLPLKLFLINGLSVVIFALWLIDGDMKREWSILKRQRIFWLFTALSAITLLSLLWSESLNGGYFNQNDNGLSYWFSKYGYKFLLLPVLLTTVDRRLIKNILSAFLSAMFISEIVSYGIFLRIWQFGFGTPEDPSPFFHHTYYSAFLLFAIFISFIRAQKESRRWLKFLYLLFTLTATVNLFINGGRTGQVTFVFAALYFIYHHYRLKMSVLFVTAMTLASIYTTAYFLSTPFQKRMSELKNDVVLMQQGQMQTSIGQRFAIWSIAVEILKEHPLTGVGLGSAKRAVETVQQEKYPDRGYLRTLSYLHNQFLQTWLESGLAGLLLLICLFYLLFRSDFYEYTLHARIYAFSLLGLYLIDSPLHLNLGISYTLLFTGLFFGYRRYRKARSD